MADETACDWGDVEALRSAVTTHISEYEAAVGHELPADLRSDVRLGRFLDAYNHDVVGATGAFRDMLAWRREVEAEPLRKEHMAALKAQLSEEEPLDASTLKQSSFPHGAEIRAAGEFGPWYVAGRSHAGDLVHIEVIGASDPSLLMEKVPEKKILEHYIGFFESRAKVLDDMSTRSGRLVRSVQVRDLSKFGLSLLRHASAMKILSAVMKTGSANYPESTAKVIFINTPTSFYSVWRVASMALRQRTRDKVSFLTSDYHCELLKHVEARVVHRLEKMRALDNHEFIDRGEDEDHLPLHYSRDVAVPAGKTEYFSVYMTRDGPRSKVALTVSPVAGGAAAAEGAAAATAAASAAPPPFELVFAAARAGEPLSAGGEAQVLQTNLAPQAYAAAGDACKFDVPFPEVLPEDVQDGFLLVRFDNKASWMYSVTVPVKAAFHQASEEASST